MTNEINGSLIHGAVVQVHTINGDMMVGAFPSGPTERVSAWTGPNVPECPHRRVRWGDHWHTLVVSNNSPDPVEVTVGVWSPDAVLLPGEMPLAMYFVGLVQPFQRKEVDFGDNGQLEPEGPTALELWYTEPSGIRWHRDRHGQLRQLSMPSANASTSDRSQAE